MSAPIAQDDAGVLRRFIADAPVAVAMLDRDMRYLAASGRWLLDYGLSRDIIGRSHYEVFPHLPARWKAMHVRCLEGAAEHSEEDRYRDRHGIDRWQRWEARPWHAADATIGGIVLFAEDITGRKREQALEQERTERLRLALGAASAGTWEWDLATDRVTGSLQERHHFGIDRAAGALPYADWLERVLPDDRARVIEATRAAVEGHAPELAIEFRVPGPDGVPRWLWSLGKVIRRDDNAALRVIGISLDITERKRNQESAARLAAIVSSSEDAIISKTLGGIVQSWNVGAERLFGYLSAEMVGQSILRIIPPERHREEDAILDALRRGRRIEQYESVRVCKDGRRVDVSLTVSPIHDAAGRPVAAAKIARDITARKKAEAALRAEDRRKDEFLATLAHELRNPLAPVRNAVHVMKSPSAGPAELGWARDVIERQVGRMARLIDDLLDVSRIALGKLALQVEPADLSKVLLEAVETSRPLIAAGGHELTLALPSETLIVQADVTRLSQVFANLLNNAAKFTAHGGRITLRAERTADTALVQVIDNGIGIAPDKLASIFELFAQARNAEAAVGDRWEGGLGIGLSLARRLVAMHGGTIEATSRGPDQGSTFEVRLPLAARALSDPPGEDDARGVPVARAWRVLVVDDNRDAAASLALLLELMGCTARQAYDGLEAVREAEAFAPDVILLDIGLPKLNGYDACQRIRALPRGADAIVIAVTGWGQDNDRERARAAGFDEHMVKPVDPEKLLERIALLERMA